MIDTHRGYVAVRLASEDDPAPYDSDLISGEIEMRAVVLKNPNPGKTYDILMHAYDGDNGESDNPVTLRLNGEPPQIGLPYELEKVQSGTSISYKKPKIGNRIDVPHKIVLEKTGDGAYNFLDFVIDADVKKKLPSTFSGTTMPSTEVCNNLLVEDGEGQGYGCWDATISGTKVAFEELALDSSPKTVSFKLDAERRLNDASDPTITIGYYVVREDDDARLTLVESKRLIIDIHRCVDTTDCP